MRVSLQLMKNMLQPLAKIVQIPQGLIVAASAVKTGIQKKILGQRHHPDLAHGQRPCVMQANDNTDNIKRRNGRQYENIIS